MSLFQYQRSFLFQVHNVIGVFVQTNNYLQITSIKMICLFDFTSFIFIERLVIRTVMLIGYWLEVG